MDVGADRVHEISPNLAARIRESIGERRDFELSRIRADSHALAASTTTRAAACVRALTLSMKLTPLARPVLSSVIS